MKYSVELSQAQDKALSFAVNDQLDWIENAVYERCRGAVDQIISIALEKSIETETPLPTSKDEIVLLAFEKGWVVALVDKPTPPAPSV